MFFPSLIYYLEVSSRIPSLASFDTVMRSSRPKQYFALEETRSPLHEGSTKHGTPQSNRGRFHSVETEPKTSVVHAFMTWLRETSCCPHDSISSDTAPKNSVSPSLSSGVGRFVSPFGGRLRPPQCGDGCSATSATEARCERHPTSSEHLTGSSCAEAIVLCRQPRTLIL